MTYIQDNLRVRALKTCNITYNHQSSIITAAALPTYEPASPQVSYTVQAGYFPLLTGDLPASVSYVGFLLAGCINNGGSARTLNWRVKRNGESIGTGSQSVAAGSKAALNADILSGNNAPVIGDVLEIYLWCSESATDMQINRHGLGILPTRFKPVNDNNKLLMSLSLVTINKADINNFSDNYAGNFQQTFLTTILPYYATFVATYSQFMFSEDSTYGVFNNKIDTNPASSVLTHASNYLCNTLPKVTQIRWQETNIKYTGA